MGGAGSSWMRGEVLPIIPLSCLRAGGGRVSANLREPRSWRRSSSRPWPQRLVSRWMTRCFLPLRKKKGNTTGRTLILISFSFLFVRSKSDYS
ncbi:hypothetical protein Hanom_Chr13g01221191 [Helianthus anomalus]